MGHIEDPADAEPGGTGLTDVQVPAEWDRVGQPSTAVIEAVAEATGCDPTDLPPLYEVVDADALDALITRQDPLPDTEVRVQFVYDGVFVTVTNDDGIRITPDRTDAR